MTSHVMKPSTVYAGRIDQCSVRLNNLYSCGALLLVPNHTFDCLYARLWPIHPQKPVGSHSNLIVFRYNLLEGLDYTEQHVLGAKNVNDRGNQAPKNIPSFWSNQSW